MKSSWQKFEKENERGGYDRLHETKEGAMKVFLMPEKGPDEVPRLMLFPSLCFLFGGVGNGSGKGESHGQVQ